jgi:hypothetical protein
MTSHSESEFRRQFVKHPEEAQKILGENGSEPKRRRRKKSLPDELQERYFHPALHIEPGFSSVGVALRRETKTILEIITSENRTYIAEEIKDALSTPPIAHPGLVGRYRKTKDTPANLSQSVALLIEKLRTLLFFENEAWYPALAVWAAGTYLFPAFATFPYIHLAGEKGSAKTKVLGGLQCVAFNALPIVDPTPAVLFRMVDSLRPTLLIDEAERMNSQEAQEIRGIINAGYKRDAYVSRCEGESHRLRFFDTYCPKAIAAIRGLGAVLEDRCVTLVMSKPPVEDPRQNMVVNSVDSEWQVIRDGFYRLPFTYVQRLFNEPAACLFPSWLRARDRELWGPLLRLASIIDQESGLNVSEDLLSLAKESIKDKGLSFESEAILGRLESLLGDRDTLQLHPVDLVSGLQDALNRKNVSPEWVAARLRSLGFKKAIPPRDAIGVIYGVTREKIEDLRRRYTPLEQPTHLHTGQPTLTKDVENRGIF